MEVFKINIGNNLCFAMNIKKIKLEQLAEWLNIDKYLLISYLKNDIKIDLPTLKEICMHIEIDVELILNSEYPIINVINNEETEILYKEWLNKFQLERLKKIVTIPSKTKKRHYIV